MTVRTKLLLYLGTCLGILVVVTAFSIASLSAVENALELINVRWLSSQEIVADLSDKTAAFRFAETYRALAAGSEGRSLADAAMASLHGSIDALSARFEAVNPDAAASTDFHRFRKAWEAYVGDHSTAGMPVPSAPTLVPRDRSDDPDAPLYSAASLALKAAGKANREAATAPPPSAPPSGISPLWSASLHLARRSS
jgi:hypothetical protein